MVDGFSGGRFLWECCLESLECLVVESLERKGWIVVFVMVFCDEWWLYDSNSACLVGKRPPSRHS